MRSGMRRGAEGKDGAEGGRRSRTRAKEEEARRGLRGCATPAGLRITRKIQSKTQATRAQSNSKLKHRNTEGRKFSNRNSSTPVQGAGGERKNRRGPSKHDVDDQLLTQAPSLGARWRSRVGQLATHSPHLAQRKVNDSNGFQR